MSNFVNSENRIAILIPCYNEAQTISKVINDWKKEYQSLLNDWQQRFNLVSSSSLSDAWNRHFLDSAQLFEFIPESAKTLYDFGSGAGFPGMVLAIMAKEKIPNLKVSLIESINKKTVYLNAVKNKLDVNVDILNCLPYS